MYTLAIMFFFQYPLYVRTYEASFVYVRKYICSQPKDNDHDICVAKNSKGILNKLASLDRLFLISFCIPQVRYTS